MNREKKEKAYQRTRMAYKIALRLSRKPSTEKLLALGLHNTFDELAEAQLIEQRSRFAQTPAGRPLLRIVGLGECIQAYQSTKELPCQIRNLYGVSPIPQSMDPTLHAGRRKARTEYIDKTTKYMGTARFTDASPYRVNAKNMVAVVANRKGKIMACASVSRATIIEAEEIGIA